MTDNLIPISLIGNYLYCPYSIYLHNVYMESDETMYHATPQTRGRVAHAAIDNKTASNRADDIFSLPVYSKGFGLMGKIDVYKKKEKKLIERKYQLKQIFQGQIYQLWAQMFRLQYSVYEVNNTDRVLNNLRIIIEDMFAKKFSGGDSVMIFDVNGVKLKKYGNAIHRDKDIVYF